ncbi:MAG: ABC transporter ATP-binding protein [Clostridia bacterium]|nr:ABC transporter ATP-binding protein [Clostridia bacterium]
MIELNSLSFSYGEKPVFSDLSATFRPGTLYGIVGPNGCGKTTLIRLLCRLNKPTSGKIFLDGIPYESYERNPFAKQVSLLPQFRSLPSISVEDFVSRGRYPYLGLTRRMTTADRDAVQRALIEVGAEDLASREINRLSGGERQRVCLAMLLAQDTPYIFLDEPTTYLDVAHRFSLLEHLKRLKEQGKCVVAVLHDLSLALRYCDEIAVLDQGSLRAFASPDSLLSSEILEQVFGVRCLPVQSEGKKDVIFIPKE